MRQNQIFPAVGDTWKSTVETMHFHRDMNYKISKIFQSSEGLIIFMKDKYGWDIPKKLGSFEATTKTQSDMFKRMKKSRVNFMIESGAELLLCNGHHYDWEKNCFFNLGLGVHYCSYPDAIGCIEEYKIEFPAEGNRKHFSQSKQMIYKKEEFYNYFDNRLSDNDWEWRFHLPGVNSDVQYNIDLKQYIKDSQFPLYIKEVVELDELDLPHEFQNRTRNWTDKSFQDFENEMCLMIFDSGTGNSIDDTGVIQDVMIAYRDLPSSHSATSVSKLLLGKSKVSNKNVAHLEGKYAGLIKQPQMFELASEVEKFLYHKKIFATKEEYSSGEEWRGAFEFIGSKHINTEELEKILNQ
jgi:hypothetical protein